jgi:hypothetical protein
MRLRLYPVMAAFALLTTVSAGGSIYIAAKTSPSWDRATQCSMPGGPCASGSAERYNHCTDLALQRGETLNGGRRSLDFFVYQCLAGHIQE